MENRLVIKKINFIKNFEVYKQDIKIKLYYGSITQTSEIFWNYSNNQIINWKFIFDYDGRSRIEFIILDDELFNVDNIIGQSCILEHFQIEENYVLDMYEFPEPIIREIDITKENEKIGSMFIEMYIIPKEFSSLYKCGNGWSLPDSYPELENFPFKKNNEIYQHIKIVDDKFGIEDKTKFDLYSEAFSRIIDEPENKPPICFGIIAPDNFGKTNFLHNLKNKILEKEKSKYKNKYNPKKAIIEFNAWSFEADNTIWASILMNIHNCLEEKIGKNKLKWIRIKKIFFPDVRTTILLILKLAIPITLLIILLIYNKEISSASNIILALITVVSSIFIVPDAFNLVKSMLFSISDNILKNIKSPDWSKKLGFMNEIKNEFFDFLNPIIKAHNLRLILLIDDLDRCSVEKVYTVLKALTLLKNSDCPIYIFIAYDSVKINDAIKTYYKTKYQVSTYESRHVLDKLVNVPFCLPEKNIAENLMLIDEYLDEESFLNLRNELIKKIPSNHLIKNNKGIVDMDKTFEEFYLFYSPNKELPMNKKTLLNEIEFMTNNFQKQDNDVIYINYKSFDNQDKILQIEQHLKSNDLTLTQLENYYTYLNKIEKETPNNLKILEIKNLIYIKFIHIKRDYTNNYYVGLDQEEIKIFQKIIEDTKTSGHSLNNYQIRKIINIYSISRFLLPNFLQIKKHSLFHLIVLTEKWHDIIIELCLEFKKLRQNFTLEKTKECIGEKDLVFFYYKENEPNQNMQFIIYLGNFTIKGIDFVELEPYIFNFDRCLLYNE